VTIRCRRKEPLLATLAALLLLSIGQVIRVSGVYGFILALAAALLVVFVASRLLRVKGRANLKGSSLALLLLLAWPVPLGALNYVGFCVPEDRFLSDDERIRKAVDRVNHYGLIVLDHALPGDVHGGQITQIPYQNVDDFLAQNQGCCHFGVPDYPRDSAPPPPMLDRLMGGYLGYVEINYMVRYLDDHNTQQATKKRWYVTMGNCGRMP
jgi:hypothetical protein